MKKAITLHLQQKDWIAVAALASVMTVLAAVLFSSAAAWMKAVSIFLIFGLVFALGLEAFRRLWNWSKQSERDYQQVESLFSLFGQVPFRQPIPPMRGWAISPDFALQLVRVIRESRPAVIVDLGSGVSTIIGGYVLEQLGSGNVFGFDHEAAFTEKTRAEINVHGLQGRASVTHAPLVPFVRDGVTWQWYDVSKFALPASIDLLVIDGPPDRLQALSRYPAIPALIDRLSPHAVVMVDDASGQNELDMVARWLKEFPGFTKEFVDCEKGAVILRRP